MRQTRETKLENDLAWARENLNEKKYLTMPKHGVWQITPLGRECLFDVAKKIYLKKPDENWWERWNEKFITEMSELGRTLSEHPPTT